MKFSECKMGELVVVDNGSTPKVGHIVGLTVNYEFQREGERGQVIPIVQFVGKQVPMPIHFKNIRKVNTGEEFTA